MTNYIQKLERRGLNGFNNYIEQIRFPYFKKISRDQVIKFDFPFTTLVGPNGSGKSSALQALYGACLGKSVSDFWFSTQMDPIKGTKNEINRFIYKFKPQGFNQSVEVLNQRTTSNKRADPDYWETQSPTKRDNMSSMPTFTKDQSPYRSKTRWNPINKEVTYIDFRSELSAFDKCFYFGHFEKSTTIKNIKDFLRSRSKSLKKMIDKSKYPQSWNSKEVTNIYELSEEALKWTNKILGKKYEDAKIIEHDIFNQPGISIVFNANGHKYSEAVAGSGEVAVVTAVVKILESKAHSLILLDEPEVSLHPGAQLKLRELLLYKSSEDNCQVVISTHSETFLKELPHEAIKLFYLDEINQTYSVANEASPEQAFFRLGGIKDGENKFLYVEDDLAKLLIEEAVKEIDSDFPNDLQIIPHPGGAESIIKNLAVNFALTNPKKSSQIVLLDGDKRISGKKLRASDIPPSEYNDLNQRLKEQTGIKGDSYPIPLDGGNAAVEIQKQQKQNTLLHILDAYHDYFHFMNEDTPEELIWKISAHSETMKVHCGNIFSQDKNYKVMFKELSKKMLNQTSSEDIFCVQKMMLNARDRENQAWVDFKLKIKDILKIAEIQS